MASKKCLGSDVPKLDRNSKINLPIRFLQFILGLIVLGTYATDLRHPPSKDFKDGSWAFATITATLSVVAAVIHGFEPILDPSPAGAFVAWDSIISILFWAVFGTFAKMFLYNKHNERMHTAIWVDLALAVLWMGSAVWGAIRVRRAIRAYKSKTLSGDQERGTGR